MLDDTRESPMAVVPLDRTGEDTAMDPDAAAARLGTPGRTAPATDRHRDDPGGLIQQPSCNPSPKRDRLSG